MPEPFDLSGHVALVTGGNSGVGLGFATGLARAGASVSIWGRDSDKLNAAVAHLRERASGGEVEGFVCDVTDEDQVVATTEATVARFGRIDSCFANAGFTIVRPFLKTSLRTWNRVMDTNMTGAFLTFRESVRHMVERGGGGKLIGTSSIGTLHGMPGQQAYSTSKCGMVGLIRSLAVEFARHDIQANVIMPGWIETPATAPAIDDEKLNSTIVHRTPARRWGTIEDLEGVAVYLASSASDFQTGDVVKLDGGYSTF